MEDHHWGRGNWNLGRNFDIHEHIPFSSPIRVLRMGEAGGGQSFSALQIAFCTHASNPHPSLPQWKITIGEGQSEFAKEFLFS
jgi:hypothetical protein